VNVQTVKIVDVKNVYVKVVNVVIVLTNKDFINAL